MGFSVKWRGQSAVYTTDEREIMAQLPVREQFVLHILKATTCGELRSAFTPGELGDVIPSDKRLPAAVTGVSLEHPPASPDQSTNRLIVYTDPEDIPFGQPKKTYALAWTKDKIRPFKTKAGKKKPWESAEPKLRVWKRWYERQGWTIFGSARGGWHIARSPEGVLHAAIIREYDQERKKRL